MSGTEGLLEDSPLEPPLSRVRAEFPLRKTYVTMVVVQLLSGLLTICARLPLHASARGVSPRRERSSCSTRRRCLFVQTEASGLVAKLTSGGPI